MSGDDAYCSVVFGILVGVFVFSVMWSKLLMTSAISCPLWSSVYECQRVECAFTSPVRTECGMFVMYCMQCCMSVVFFCIPVPAFLVGMVLSGSPDAAYFRSEIARFDTCISATIWALEAPLLSFIIVLR